MPRPQCSVYIAMSLDGFIARTNGAIDWLSIAEHGTEDYGYKEFFGSIDTLVVGRKTYETVLAFGKWPWGEKRVVVLTKGERTPQHNEEMYGGDLVALVERLGAESAKRVYVDGGVVIAQFLAAGLVDDVTVSVIPIFLGEGTPITPRIGRDVRLTLREHRAYESGLVQLRYATMAAS